MEKEKSVTRRITELVKTSYFIDSNERKLFDEGKVSRQ